LQIASFLTVENSKMQVFDSCYTKKRVFFTVENCKMQVL